MSPVQQVSRPSGSPWGKLVTLALVLGLMALGAWLVMRDLGDGGKDGGATASGAAAEASATAGGDEAPTPIEPLMAVPTLDRAAAYEPRDKIVDVDISEYAGYAGLVVANGGLAPNPDSFFAKQYGFQVRLTLSEEEGWSKLNNGRIAASVTTADVLAVLGRQFEVVVPAQIGFSRGADQLVVDSGIAGINALKGKVLAASQFNESEFLVRYLASEAGVPVKVLRDLSARPGPGELGLVFYEDAFVACDAYAAELAAASPRLNGCMGWTPRTEEVVESSAGKAKVLVSNRNLLVVADLLLVNKGFATAHPEWVRGLVHGLLQGNSQLRADPQPHLATIAKAFGWTAEETRDELSKVHLSNLPENRAFFSGTMDAAGSFSGIYQSSVLAYGALLKNPADPNRFVDPSHLDALAKAGEFAGQQVAIAPIRSGAPVSLEGDPLLSKDIRFFYEPNSAELDRDAPQNAEYIDTIKNFLAVSPGSVVMLRGHVDGTKKPEFERQGGQALVREMAMHAMELSRRRADSVKDALLHKYPKLDPERIEVIGRGWEEPASENGDLNRRVEVQWFTLE
jgi:NitT/TauT family transport system substrate-binding protein